MVKKRNGVILASVLAFVLIGCGGSDTGCCSDSSVVEEAPVLMVEQSSVSVETPLFATSSYTVDEKEQGIESPILGTLSIDESYDDFLVVPQDEFYNTIVPDLGENAIEDDANETILSDELSIVEDSETLAIPKCAIADIELPQEGENNTTITWESNHKEVLDNQGHVTRPGKCDQDVHVVLVATISKGDVQVQKEFFVGVIKEMGSDAEAAKRDGDIIRYFVPRVIDAETIKLAENGLNGSFVTWESSNEEIISLDGTVTAGEEDSEVTLTLTVVNNGETNVSSVTVLVKAVGSE